MNSNKFIIICLILLSILLFNNTLYAAENNEITDMNYSNLQNNQINLEPNEIINSAYVQTDRELQNQFSKIRQSEEKYHELNLSKREYSLQREFICSEDENLEKIIIINGNNSVINGNNDTNFASVPRYVKLSINNLKIINMNDIVGGAIHNRGNLILTNVTFENNMATGNAQGGGAIFNDGFMNITNSTFSNNIAYKSGGAIYNSETVLETNYNITNCVFVNNSASDAIIHNIGNIHATISNSSFNDNHALYTIHNERSNLTIVNSSLIHENVEIILINQDNCILNNIIMSNKLDTLIINEGTLYLNKSQFNKNNAKTIMNNSENIYINNITISDNIINSLLNNILVANNTTSLIYINNSIISNNNINYFGIKNFNECSKVKIENSLFKNNTSIENEGILNDYDGKIEVLNSKFHNNTAYELFKGNLDNFYHIESNEYYGNNLNSKMDVNYTSENNILDLSIFLSTDQIYNTSVTSGNIFIYQENELILETNVLNSNTSIKIPINPNLNREFNVTYNGLNDFINQNEEIILEIQNGAYNITINNISSEITYCGYINYNITIKNIDNIPSNNLILANIVPNGFELYNSTMNILENKCSIPIINVNDSVTISINVQPENYRDLFLNLNILDLNKNIYVSEEHFVKFIKPTITLNDLNSYPGSLINITANVNNYNKDTISDIKIKFQYKFIEDINITYKDNTITVLNYKIDENLIKKAYNLEIICFDNELSEEFSTSSKLNINKLDTYSILSSNISNNILNFSAKIYDIYNQEVNSGTGLIKLNDKTIKSIKVINGSATLNDYKISNFKDNQEYNITLIFSGNNLYNTHSNTTTNAINKEKINLTLEYAVEDDVLTIYSTVTTKGNISEGYITFKINGKSISSKIELKENQIIYIYKTNNFNRIDNVSIFYYSEMLYENNYLTIYSEENKINPI